MCVCLRVQAIGRELNDLPFLSHNSIWVRQTNGQTQTGSCAQVITARSKLRKVLFLALTVTFLFVILFVNQISRERLNGFAQIHREADYLQIFSSR